MNDDTIRRIAPSDLLLINRTPTEPSSEDEPLREAICQTTSAWSSSTSEPVCSGCGGLGYYLLKVAYGHPKWGVPQPCECKLRRDRERVANELEQRLRAERGMFAAATLDGYDWQRDVSVPAVWHENALDGQPRTYTPAQQRKSLDAARAKLDAYVARPDGGLLLVGPYGTGKTHLAAALANLWTASERGAQYLSTPVLLKDLRAGIADHSTDARLEQFIRLEFLALDDFGAEHLSDWAGSLLFDLINERYNAGRTTVVTSNYPITALTGRIGSRLVQMCEIVPVVAYDYRTILAARRHTRGAA